MASVYYDNKPFDVYNLGNDYSVSGYGQASALILSAKYAGTPGQLDYYVSGYEWVADETVSGHAFVNGVYNNVSGTELPFLYPSGTYATTAVSNAPDTLTFPDALTGKPVEELLGVKGTKK